MTTQIHNQNGGSCCCNDEELREPLLSEDEQQQVLELEEEESSPFSQNSRNTDETLNPDDTKNITLPLWFTRCCCSSRQPFKANHNVFFILLTSVLYGISDSIWGGTVVAAYLKKLGHGRNSPVGDVEAANGFATLVSALPIGYLADRYGRSKVVAGGGGLMMITALLHAVLLGWIGNDNDIDNATTTHTPKNGPALWLFGAIMALWGIGGGIVNGPTQALYADSTPAGKRSTYYVYLFSSYLVASSIGPLVSIILFQTIGNDWTLYDLRMVIYVGLVISLVNSAIMMLLDDDKALVEEGGSSSGGVNHNSTPTTNANHNDGDKREELPSPTDEEIAVEEQIVTMNDTGHSEMLEQQESQEQQTSNTDNDDFNPINSRRRFIPYIIIFSSCILTLGAGMTVKFFPLFFKDDIGLSPTQVQIIYVLVPIAMALLSGVCKFVATTCGLGRVQAAVLFKSAGVGALYAMVFCKKYLDQHPFILIPIFILRTGFMNAPYPLEESILMDYVPKNERATWKSLDSIAMFGWCGSAAIGGWLTDKYDYTYTFFITALLQTFGILVFALLLPLVPRKEEELTTQQQDQHQRHVSTSSTSTNSDIFQSSTASLSTDNISNS